MLSLVKMLLKGLVVGRALYGHGNYLVNLGKSWNCVFEFLWEPCNKDWLGFVTKSFLKKMLACH